MAAPLTQGKELFVALSGVRGFVRLLTCPEWRRDAEQQPGGIRLGKLAADNTQPVAVLMVGIRINKWRLPWHWVPLLLAMPVMIRELTTDPAGGLLGYRLLIGPGPRQAMLIQYWRGIDELHEFTRRPASTHLAAQKRLWRHYAAAGGAVGVWHEILPVPGAAYECLYGNMPPTGIGALRGLRPLAWQMDATAATRPGQAGHRPSRRI
jgi:hypothetical protein